MALIGPVLVIDPDQFFNGTKHLHVTRSTVSLETR